MSARSFSIGLRSEYGGRNSSPVPAFPEQGVFHDYGLSAPYTLRHIVFNFSKRSPAIDF
jgi:hypothetical protein